ncbi:hypothetical protein AOB60_28245 [Streptomyces noursei]|uniref:Uncharacterized protein n=2 Tax=Streptomyces TaxID=1883 RepID=A0A2N8PAK8_STRNR|nr:hypothetical protein AOB60_28245 [Streptomyces noursei]
MARRGRRLLGTRGGDRRGPTEPTEPTEEGPEMVSVIAAYVVLGILLGAVAHLPVSASVTAGVGIGAWLLVFLVRERLNDR